MHVKLYKMRSLALANGKTSFIDLDLEFDGRRAFVVWESIALRGFTLKARVEIDPELLQVGAGRGCDFIYCGPLVLPRPVNN